MKYIIEIDTDKVFTDGQNNKLYRAKGFNSLVFDETGLSKLEPAQEAWEKDLKEVQKATEDVEYNRGLEDGYERKKEEWEKELAKHYDRGYTQALADYRKFERVFESGADIFEDIRNTDGTISLDMILEYLPMREIMARIKAYEEKKKAEEFKKTFPFQLGDVVIHKEKPIMGIVIGAWQQEKRDDNWIDGVRIITRNTEILEFKVDEMYKAEGKHYDIESILKELGE